MKNVRKHHNSFKVSASNHGLHYSYQLQKYVPHIAYSDSTETNSTIEFDQALSIRDQKLACETKLGSGKIQLGAKLLDVWNAQRFLGIR